jgi:hypothetical protein
MAPPWWKALQGMFYFYQKLCNGSAIEESLTGECFIFIKKCVMAPPWWKALQGSVLFLSKNV